MPSDSPAVRQTPAGLHPVSLALAGAVAVGAIWYGLAHSTGLIFHLMPAAPVIAAAWILRRADDGASRSSRLAALGASAVIALVMTVLLARAGRPLDEPLLTGVVIGAGVVLGARLLRVPKAESASS